MKKIVIALLILSSLVPLDAQVIKDSNYYRQKGYQVFPELGFAINASVELEDISKILTKANQALQTLEKYKSVLDEIREYIEKEGEHTDCSGEPIYYLDEEQEEELLQILDKVGSNE